MKNFPLLKEQKVSNISYYFCSPFHFFSQNGKYNKPNLLKYCLNTGKNAMNLFIISTSSSKDVVCGWTSFFHFAHTHKITPDCMRRPFHRFESMNSPPPPINLFKKTVWKLCEERFSWNTDDYQALPVEYLTRKVTKGSYNEHQSNWILTQRYSF